MTQHLPDWPEQDVDWGLPCGTTVHIACVRCGQMLTVELDTGEPQTFEHPGDPGGWFPSDDACVCVEHYDNAEQARFEDACETAGRAGLPPFDPSTLPF